MRDRRAASTSCRQRRIDVVLRTVASHQRAIQPRGGGAADQMRHFNLEQRQRDYGAACRCRVYQHMSNYIWLDLRLAIYNRFAPPRSRWHNFVVFQWRFDDSIK
jgi:hypothetical protein